MTFGATFSRVIQRPFGGVSSVWYLPSGISVANCIAAYQPKFAESYALSKVNLAHPGTYDLTNGTNYPTWGKIIGWSFALNQFLIIGDGTAVVLKPFSAIARIKRAATTVNKTILGGYENSSMQWRLNAGNKSELVKQGVAVIGGSTNAVDTIHAIVGVTYSESGVYIFYTNGVADGTGTNNQTITADTDRIGAALTLQTYNGTIEYLSLYNCALTEGQIANIGTAINADIIVRSIGISLVVFDGNSMTAEDISIYPATALAQLTGVWYSYNVGVSGQTTIQMIEDGVAQIDSYYSSYKNAVVVCWEGTNDIKLGASATDAYNNLVTYCQARQAAGFKVVILTILPRSDAGTPVDFNTSRATVNTNIRNNYATFADAVADVAANTDIGEDGDSENATYYTDKVHLKTAGYNIVAGIVAATINAL